MWQQLAAGPPSNLKPTVLKITAAMDDRLLCIYSYCTAYDFSCWLCPHGLHAVFYFRQKHWLCQRCFFLISQDFLSLACVQLFCWITLEDLNQVDKFKCYIEVQQEGRTPTKQKHCLLCTNSCQCCCLWLSKFFPTHTDFVLLCFSWEDTRCVIAAPA